MLKVWALGTEITSNLGYVLAPESLESSWTLCHTPQIREAMTVS